MAANQEKIHVLFVDDNEDEFVLMNWLLGSSPEFNSELTCVTNIAAACEVIELQSVDIILLDNKLHLNDDFRTSVPILRATNFTGPIGIVSSSIAPDYFQEFEEYGADFRIGKNELDRNALAFIIEEFIKKKSVLFDD